ncbi:MAG: hypothetical protein ACF8NJ_11365 [Phycisphaerales bacterium JB038]
MSKSKRRFEGYTPEELQSLRSDEDIERALQIPRDQCPRRYCWWWRWLSFAWDVPISEGCTFVEDRDRGKVSPEWPNIDRPCCRCVPGSPADHYEPREPHMLEDGVDIHRWDRQPKDE